jgi:hypothetical protein
MAGASARCEAGRLALRSLVLSPTWSRLSAVLNHAVEPDAVTFGVLEDGNKAMLADRCARLQH